MLPLFDRYFRLTHFQFSCSASLAGFGRFSVIYHLYVFSFIQHTNLVQCKFYFSSSLQDSYYLSALKASQLWDVSRLRNIESNLMSCICKCWTAECFDWWTYHSIPTSRPLEVCVTTLRSRALTGADLRSPLTLDDTSTLRSSPQVSLLKQRVSFEV